MYGSDFSYSCLMFKLSEHSRAHNLINDQTQMCWGQTSIINIYLINDQTEVHE